MSECRHEWKMTNIEYGFTVFEKCVETKCLRTYFSTEDTWDDYRENDQRWNIVENAQSFRFDLKCARCGKLESFAELMGLMFCPGCMPDCPVEILQKQLRRERTWLLVAFGFLPQALETPIPQAKLDILSEHFNQRRDTSRSKVKIVAFNTIKDVSLCKGEFIHDVGMLSLEAPEERKPLF